MEMPGHPDVRIVSIDDGHDGVTKAMQLIQEEGLRVLLIAADGTPALAMIPAEDLELLEELEDRADLADSLSALKEADELGEVSSLGDVKQRLGI
jgi:hypothetical protein